MLKTLEKLPDRYIRNDVLPNRPLHQDQCAYHAGKSTETALHQLMPEHALQTKKVLLCTFLDVGEAFDNTSPGSISKITKTSE